MLRYGRSRSFKVIEIGINRKPICDFLLVFYCNFMLILIFVFFVFYFVLF